jgi:hypothetical protein
VPWQLAKKNRKSASEVLKGRGFNSVRKTPKSAAGALKGRGFSRALHRFSKTYGTAGNSLRKNSKIGV